jgi:hypothetical protein
MGGGEVSGPATDDFAWRPSGEFGESIVAAEIDAFCISEGNRIRNGVDQRLKRGVLPARLLLR